MKTTFSRVTVFRAPIPAEGRVELSDRRFLADLTPLALLREYGGRVRVSESIAASVGRSEADRSNAAALAGRAEREVLDRLGSLYKITRVK